MFLRITDNLVENIHITKLSPLLILARKIEKPTPDTKMLLTLSFQNLFLVTHLGHTKLITCFLDLTGGT